MFNYLVLANFTASGPYFQVSYQLKEYLVYWRCYFHQVARVYLYCKWEFFIFFFLKANVLVICINFWLCLLVGLDEHSEFISLFSLHRMTSLCLCLSVSLSVSLYLFDFSYLLGCHHESIKSKLKWSSKSMNFPVSEFSWSFRCYCFIFIVWWNCLLVLNLFLVCGTIELIFPFLVLFIHYFSDT